MTFTIDDSIGGRVKIGVLIEKTHDSGWVKIIREVYLRSYQKHHHTYPSSVRVSLVRLKMMGASTRRTRPNAMFIASALSVPALHGDSIDALFSLAIPLALPDPIEIPDIVFVIAFRQKPASHHGSCLRNLRRPYTSLRALIIILHCIEKVKAKNAVFKPEK